MLTCMTPRRFARLVAVAMLLAMAAPMAVLASRNVAVCGALRHDCDRGQQLVACCCHASQPSRPVTAERAVAALAPACAYRPSWATPVGQADAQWRVTAWAPAPLRPGDRLALLSILQL